MSISRPTPSEVAAFDRLIQVGDVLVNRHDQGEFSFRTGSPIPAGSRKIEIVHKLPGNIVKYRTLAHPGRLGSVATEGIMSTRQLLIRFRVVREGEDLAVRAIREA